MMTRIFSSLLAFLFASVCLAADAPASKALFDPNAEGAAKRIGPNGMAQPEVSYALAGNGIEVAIAANGTSSFPGIVIAPPAPWDLSAFGHVEARITNLGAAPVRLSLRVDDDGPWQSEPYSAEKISVKPGQSGTISTIFNTSKPKPSTSCGRLLANSSGPRCSSPVAKIPSAYSG